MTPEYDMEMLKIRCDQCMEALDAAMQHEGARKQTVRWRFERLKRELHEFRSVMWPPKPKQQEA